MTDDRKVGRAVDQKEPPIGDGSGDGEPPHVYTIGPDERPSTKVVVAVATTIGRPETSLEPLGRSVDPDALDRLFARAGDGLQSITFAYGETTVTVRSTGEVVVRR